MQNLTNRLFAVGCALLYALVACLVPRYFPLIEPDSNGYLDFTNNRTAFYPLFIRLCRSLGLSLDQIAYLQVGLFAISLVVLLLALMRAGMPRVLVAVFVAALAANTYFPSFHWTMMTESLFCSVGAIAFAACIDFFRTGRVGFLAIFSFGVSVMAGLRPIGLALMPLVFVAAWLVGRRSEASRVTLMLAVVLPLLIGGGAEIAARRIEHGSDQSSVLPNALTGKAGMLIQRDTQFTGPYAEALNQLGRQLYEIYVPVHQFLDRVPSLAAWPILTAGYEAAAHFQLLVPELDDWSKRTGVTTDQLRNELARQTILQNIPGYIRLTAIHYFGQWSAAALRFPPTAKAVESYVSNDPKVPLNKILGDVYLHPKPTLSSIVIYPAFLTAGLISLVLTMLLLVFVVRPSLGNQGRGQTLMIACFLAATVHAPLVLMSLINVSTTRFVMAFYPQLLMAGLFLLLALMPQLRIARAKDGSHGDNV